MARTSYDKEDMQIVSVKGKEYEFTDIRLDRSTIPEGKYMYEIADGDSDGEPCRIKEGIMVNFYGTLVTDEPLDFGNDNTMWLNEGDFFFV